jgi:hypothetical protein
MRLFHSLMNLFERGAHAGAAPLPAERLDEIPFFFFLLSVGQGRTPCLCGEGQRLVAHAPLVVCIVEIRVQTLVVVPPGKVPDS